MGFLDKVFGRDDSSTPRPDIDFGRYSDGYKSKEQVDAWKASLELYKDKKYLESYQTFFQYLGDPDLKNVEVNQEHENGPLSFLFYQGSKIVKGSATNERVQAEIHVVEAPNPSVAMMRKLMEMNFALRYGRFALKPNNIIALKFSTSALDGSPEKLYYAFKEISLRADKQDDLLMNQFRGLQQTDSDHTEDIPETEKAIKFKYMQKWLSDTLARVEELDFKEFSGGIAYLLLNLGYRIDYLIKPEGPLMESIEKIHNSYFAQNNKSLDEKVAFMKKEYRKILARTEAEIGKELYKTTSTFGITSPTQHQVIANFIEDQGKNMPWYKEHKHDDIALAIMEYITGYSLFYYGMPEPIHELMELLMEVIHTDYYHELGFKEDYVDETSGKLNKGNICSEVTAIQKRWVGKYGKDLRIDDSQLHFSNKVDFTQSLLNQIKALKMTLKK